MGSRCEQEDNSMLQIDLSHFDDPYQDATGVDIDDEDPPLRIHTWMLIVVVAGGLCLLILVISLTLIACRLRSNNEPLEEKRRPQMDMTRIPSEKLGPPGVDVWELRTSRKLLYKCLDLRHCCSQPIRALRSVFSRQGNNDMRKYYDCELTEMRVSLL